MLRVQGLGRWVWGLGFRVPSAFRLKALQPRKSLGLRTLARPAVIASLLGKRRDSGFAL